MSDGFQTKNTQQRLEQSIRTLTTKRRSFPWRLIWPRWLLVSLMLLSFTGCGFAPDSSDYGSTSYPTKTSSINGLGVFEQLCKQAGSKCIVTNRLSAKLDKVDAIVLIGESFHPPAKEARDWIEEWLAGEAGRTVVYFGRDFDAELYYRERTFDGVPADAKQQATLEWMNAQSKHDITLFEQLPDDVFCRWFTLRIHGPRQDINQFQGAWSDSLAGQSGSWPVRVLLEPPDPAQEADVPTWPTSAATTTTPIAPANAMKTEDDEPVVFTSIWEPWDIDNDETWAEEWEKAPEAEVLLSGVDGTPLVTRLTSDRYPDSQILTIVNGAPMLNGSLVEPHFRTVAHAIINQLQPAKRIALLPFNEYGILVSRLQEENDAAGLTVLTTWPMNIIVAHLAFWGILICLALFPILGRPQKVRPRSLADFGSHAESLGQMLQRTGDLPFALRTIADYYRTVRGEAVPGWVESALQQTASPSPTDSGTPSAEAAASTANQLPGTDSLAVATANAPAAESQDALAEDAAPPATQLRDSERQADTLSEDTIVAAEVIPEQEQPHEQQQQPERSRPQGGSNIDPSA